MKKAETANKPDEILINQISEVIGVEYINHRYVKCFFLISTSVSDRASPSRSRLTGKQQHKQVRPRAPQMGTVPKTKEASLAGPAAVRASDQTRVPPSFPYRFCSAYLTPTFPPCAQNSREPPMLRCQKNHARCKTTTIIYPTPADKCVMNPFGTTVYSSVLPG